MGPVLYAIVCMTSSFYENLSPILNVAEICSLSDKKHATTTCPIRILSLSLHSISLSYISIYMGERGILSGTFHRTKRGVQFTYPIAQPF